MTRGKSVRRSVMDVVHTSYNDFSETAELQVILAPAMGDGGCELVDVSGDAPRATLPG